MYSTDYHTHTLRCGHAGGMARDYVEAAIKKGFSEIAVTDHIPLYFLAGDDPLPDFAMAKSEWPGYLAEITQLKVEYAGRIEVLLGVEADYVEGHEAELRDLLDSRAWDVVLGSVHWVAGDWIDGPGSSRRHHSEGSEFLWNEYFRLLSKACSTGFFDVITHFDLPKKFGHHMPESCRESRRAAIQAAVEAGVAIEISSAGLRKPVHQEYPDPALLKDLVSAGLSVVFSSDAHAPAEVGWEFERMVHAATLAGATEHVSFHRRQRTSHPLDR